MYVTYVKYHHITKTHSCHIFKHDADVAVRAASSDERKRKKQDYMNNNQSLTLSNLLVSM